MRRKLLHSLFPSLLCLLLFIAAGCAASPSPGENRFDHYSSTQAAASQPGLTTSGAASLEDGSSASGTGGPSEAPQSQDGAQSREEGAASAPSSSPSSAAPPVSSAAPQPPANEIRVTLTVECHTAVQQGNDIALAVSQDGVILAPQTITLQPGATVFDALQQSGLVISSSSSMFGVYVKSIQSLSEGACGGGSGWQYSVNGAFPSVSCSAYTLSDGDQVAWRYTCDSGNDLS